ncbi:OPA family glycerol-3-phosphate transporter-like MFS transporter [Paenibacillus taihuensis]|uniref:OPA family glycerol-3-phosphate transporter-like MFS transporter n=1 Tax=Paenibacillus taihuensis TaxID=1156355 RepID=A0A3D9RV49_9BACL|nr:MFS transporter [Paenibacillus taihuensis]REE83869.1 OPA family glycerol-3-phosphate transporter-like MFS transporter [Paenibacillus taihuensis]
MSAIEGPAALTKKQAFIFSLLCCLVYGASYLTRYNFMAAVSAIADALEVSNRFAGLAVVGSFIAYGIGQPIFGVLGDRFHPRILIFSGLLSSAVCNALISFMSDMTALIVIWFLNGIFQSMLWPPLVRIMSQNLTRDQYRKTSVGVTTASAIGTIAVYLLVPLSILLSGWRLSFAVPALIGMSAAFIWLFGTRAYGNEARIGEQTTTDQQETPKGAGMPASDIRLRTLIGTSGMIPVLLVVVFQGALRDGITTWLPSYIQDVYHIQTSLSILTTVIVPVFSILSVSIAAYVQRYVANEIKTTVYLWTIVVAASLALTIFALNAMESVLLMAILMGCIHGINLMLVSHIPAHFANYRKVSTVSGVVNAFAYLGSAISIYGIAALTEWVDWGNIMLVLGCISIIGLLVSMLCVGKWRAFLHSTEAAQTNMHLP